MSEVGGVRARPYATLLAKGEDRKQRILEVAERLLARHGWRNTSLAQIAKEAGVSAAGLLHHFESKEQLLNAVLDARDADDDIHADRSGDLVTEIMPSRRALRPCTRAGRHLHRAADREHRPRRAAARPPARPATRGGRHRRRADRSAVSATGCYRTDFDPAIKAVEILAFVNGMETAWLLDPSIPLAEVFKGYGETLARDFAPARHRKRTERRHEVPARRRCAERLRGRAVRRRLAGRPGDGRLGRHRARIRGDDDVRPLEILGVDTTIWNRRSRSGRTGRIRRPSPSPPSCSRATSGSVKAC